MSAALIVLVCFILPWIQLSCGGTRDTASGADLARDGSHGLWLIPLLMIALIFFGSVKAWKERHDLFALISLISALVSIYLMNRERMKFEDGVGFIRVGITGWFWLGFISSIAIAVLSALRLLTRRRLRE